MDGASDQEKIELLYKKSLGVPNAYPGTTHLPNELALKMDGAEAIS